MLDKQFIHYGHKRLGIIMLRLIDKVVATMCLTAAVLVIMGSNAPISNAQVAFSTSVLANTQQGSTIRHNQKQQVATVYRSPDCSCCGGWIDHLKTQGFEIKDFTTNEIDAIKQKYNVPDNLTSCHTAIVNGYVIEGHVPAPDIKRLLQEQPSFAGLSVPQMPVGTPGMEIGNKKDPFTVFSFERNGTVGVFNNYPSS